MHSPTQPHNGTYNGRASIVFLTAVTPVETELIWNGLRCATCVRRGAPSGLLAEESVIMAHACRNYARYYLLAGGTGDAAASGGLAWPPEIFL